MAIITLLIGAILGISITLWLNRKPADVRHALPTEWPLTPRALVSSHERKVWLWLSKVMFDHQILIKLPVTRFSMPAKESDAEYWHHILNGVYCTFTICNLEGRVIGCIDVAGRVGLTMRNQTLKHALLNQLGMQYWVIDPDNFPQMMQLRLAFLGEQAARAGQLSQLEAQFKDVAWNLQSVVSRKRSQAQPGTVTDSEMAALTAEFEAAASQGGWDSNNSFLTPLDSRAAPLQH